MQPMVIEKHTPENVNDADGPGLHTMTIETHVTLYLTCNNTLVKIVLCKQNMARKLRWFIAGLIIPFSAGTVFIRQNLASVDGRF